MSTHQNPGTASASAMKTEPETKEITATIEEATAPTAAPSVQPSPEISKTSETSPDSENHLREILENNVQVSPPIVKMAKVSDLKPHPENERIYGPPKLNAPLLESIRASGIRQPLLVNGDGTTLQGHSRLYVARELGLPEVPAIFVDISDPDEQLETLLSGNSQRDKTNEQRAREFKGYHDIETRRAKARQATNAGAGKDKGGPKSRKKAQPVENVSEAESGKARDIAAAKVGWSGPTAQSALKIVEAIDAAIASAHDSEAVRSIREKLETSVNAAFQECKKLNLLKTVAAAPGMPTSKKVHTEGFSKSDQAFAAQQFDPFTKDNQLNKVAIASLTVTQPSKSNDDAIRASILVLPDSIDLLASRYSDAVINSLADEMESAPKWTFTFETTDFNRAAQFEWPENAWVGLTVSTQKEIDAAEAVAMSIRAKTRWIHCILDSESLAFKELDPFDWVVVSVQNEKLHWVDVEPILKAARKAKCSVFFESSVKCRPQEFPKAHKAK